jgi:hypothetical protein
MCRHQRLAQAIADRIVIVIVFAAIAVAASLLAASLTP